MNEQAAFAYARCAAPREEERQQRIEEYLPLVQHILGRLPIHLPTTLDREDLFEAGVLGLIQAADSFDPTRGAIFKTHAYVNIKGAILDEIRRHDPVPRSRRDRLREVAKGEEELSIELGRAPTPEEIAEHVGLSVAQVENALIHAHGASVLSLDDGPGGGEGGEKLRLVDCVRMPESPDPTDAVAKKELEGDLSQAIQQLPERERRVVVLYYGEGLLLKEIGMILGITESRVCQLHSRALYRLNKKLESHASTT